MCERVLVLSEARTRNKIASNIQMLTYVRDLILVGNTNVESSVSVCALVERQMENVPNNYASIRVIGT